MRTVNREWIAAVCLVACVLVAGWGCGSAPKRDGAADPDSGAPPMDPEKQLEMWESLGEPGEAHRRLDPMVGEFRAVSRSWLAPDDEPLVAEASATNEWILGGRFLRTEFRGEMMETPFEGLGILGYDNAKERYVGFWCDSLSTMMLPISEGTCSEDGKVLTMKNTYASPVLGIDIVSRDVYTIESRDRHVFEMYETGPDGTETKTLEIVYTRVE